MERRRGVSATVNLLIGLAMGLNLLALGSSRLPSVIRAVAVQGMVLGIMPLLMETHFDWRVAAVAIVTVAVKGIKASLQVEASTIRNPFATGEWQRFTCGS